jgi:hypothetical protein
VEGGEYATETPNDELVILGDLKNPMTGRMFKRDAAILAKNTEKETKKLRTLVEEAGDMKVTRPIDKIAIDTVGLMADASRKKLREYNETKNSYIAMQEAMNKTADEMGLDAKSLSMGKVKRAKKGATISKAQEGAKIYERTDSPLRRRLNYLRGSLQNSPHAEVLSNLYENTIGIADYDKPYIGGVAPAPSILKNYTPTIATFRKANPGIISDAIKRAERAVENQAIQEELTAAFGGAGRKSSGIKGSTKVRTHDVPTYGKVMVEGQAVKRPTYQLINGKVYEVTPGGSSVPWKEIGYGTAGTAAAVALYQLISQNNPSGNIDSTYQTALENSGGDPTVALQNLTSSSKVDPMYIDMPNPFRSTPTNPQLYKEMLPEIEIIGKKKKDISAGSSATPATPASQTSASKTKVVIDDKNFTGPPTMEQMMKGEEYTVPTYGGNEKTKVIHTGEDANKWKEYVDYGMEALDSILPYFRPSDTERLDPRQLMGEMFAMTDKEEPVQAQLYSPQLGTPYSMSLQDQKNDVIAQTRAAQRMAGNNPAAQAMIASQASQALNKIQAEEFRLNQAMRDKVYGENRAMLNDAQLKNLQILDQQYQRQAQAKSNTKALWREALMSISDKYMKNQLNNRTLAAYENLYNYRFDPRFRAQNWNAPYYAWDYSGSGFDEDEYGDRRDMVARFEVDPITGERRVVGWRKKTKEEREKESKGITARNGAIIKAMRNL